MKFSQNFAIIFIHLIMMSENFIQQGDAGTGNFKWVINNIGFGFYPSRTIDVDKTCKLYIANRNTLKLKYSREAVYRLESLCENVIKENRLKEANAKKEKKKENEIQTYRAHLLPRLKSFLLKDFLDMRY